MENHKAIIKHDKRSPELSSNMIHHQYPSSSMIHHHEPSSSKKLPIIIHDKSLKTIKNHHEQSTYA